MMGVDFIDCALEGALWIMLVGAPDYAEFPHEYS